LDLKPTTSESNGLRSNVLDKTQEDDVIPMAKGISIKEQEDNVHSYNINIDLIRSQISFCDDFLL
jgi:hypothetical protein